MSDKDWNFNNRLAGRIFNELKSGEKRTVTFDEFAGTSGNFVRAAKGYGLCIVGTTTEYVTVQKF